MSLAAATRRGPPLAAATLLRLAGLVVALAAFVAAFGPPRRLAQRLGWRLGERAPVAFQKLLCRGLGVAVREHGGLAALGPTLIVSNHVSWLDIPILASLAPMTFLAKKEIGSHWIGRALVAMQGAIYVDRGRRRCIPHVNARMAERMGAGAPVVLFAEATTGDGNRLLRFRTSHFEAVRQAAARPGKCAFIQPVFLHYSRLGGVPMARLDRPRVAWYGDMTFLPHFFGYASGGGATCDVYWGEPIPISTDIDRKTAARLTEAAIRRLSAEARAGWVAGIFAEPEKA